MANPLDQLIQMQLTGGAPNVVPPMAPAMPLPAAVPTPMQNTNVPPPAPTNASPFSDSRFLLDLGARLLQPRSETQGQFGFAAGALNEAVNAMSQRKAASAASEREDKKLGLKEREVGVQEGQQKTAAKSATYVDRLREQQTAESRAQEQKLLAEAANEKATGGTKGSTAAGVQETNQVAAALKAAFPASYQGKDAEAKAILDAKTFMARAKTNPTEEFMKLYGSYLEANAFTASEEEKAAMLKQMLGMTEALKKSVSPQGIAGEPSKPAATVDPSKQVIPQGKLFAGLTIDGARKQLELFMQNPVALDYYVAGQTSDPAVQQVMKAQLKELMKTLPRRP